MNESWYEVWADEGHEGAPYVLLLQPANGRYDIVDPAKNYERVFQGADYDEARFWLLEDEFVLVGRKVPD